MIFRQNNTKVGKHNCMDKKKDTSTRKVKRTETKRPVFIFEMETIEHYSKTPTLCTSEHF